MDKLKRILEALAWLLTGVIIGVALFCLVKEIADFWVTLVLMVTFMGVWW